jgi:hypothetical protein
MYRHKIITGITMLAIASLSGTAQAEDALAPVPQLASIAAQPLASEPAINPDPASLQNQAVAQGDDALSDGDLGDLRGGDALVIGDQALTAINNGNVLNGNYAAGVVSISDNAFSSFNGLGNIVINTGAQNNLQSAMNVTINFAQ